jgi:hypothetical protein
MARLGATDAERRMESMAVQTAVTDTSTEYDAAWVLLETLVRHFGEEAPAGEVATHAADPTFSWGRLIEHALTHKLQALVAATLLREEFGPTVPKRIRGYFRDALNVNRHRVRVYGAAAARVVAAAREARLPLAARKGIAVEHTLYGARAARYFTDVDFMIRPEDAAAFTAVMGGLGYAGGEYDVGRSAIVPHDRKTLITYKLNPDHLPRFAALTGDPVVEYVEADVATSFTWTRSDYHVPLEGALAELVWIRLPHRDAEQSDAELPTFSALYQLIDTTLHLFREAFVESASRDGNPVTLSQFLDARLIWKRHGAQLAAGGGREALATLGIEAPVAWVLWHLDRLFGTRATADLGLEGVVDDTWAASWRPVGGGVERWHGDMRRRLYHGGSLFEPATAALAR